MKRYRLTSLAFLWFGLKSEAFQLNQRSSVAGRRTKASVREWHEDSYSSLLPISGVSFGPRGPCDAALLHSTAEDVTESGPQKEQLTKAYSLSIYMARLPFFSFSYQIER